MAAPVRVLLADDHAPTREDVREALVRHGGFEICAEAGDAPAAVEAALRERPDVCLLDLRMPGGGLTALYEITARLPGTRAVMLTVSHEGQDVVAALRAGAAGYLVKDMDPHAFGRTLEAVLRGEVALPRDLVAAAAEALRDRSPRRRDLAGEGPLTSREWEVLELLRRGRSTAEIARDLAISAGTVRTHVNALVRKLDVADREALISGLDGS